MKTKIICSVPLLVAGLTELCCAQDRLSLNDAIDRALASRASLKAEEERISAAKSLKLQAGLHPNPEFQFQNENLRPGQTYSQDVDTIAQFNQQLDILGKRRERVTVASKGIASAQADYQQVRWQLIQNVKMAYWNARGAQQISETLAATARDFQKTIDYHAAQFSAGAIAELDLLRVKLEGERLKIAAELAALDANRARYQLLKEIGQGVANNVVLTEPLAPDRPPLPIAIEQVLSQRTEIKAARAALEHALANLKLQAVAARPDLSISVGYKRTQLPDTTNGVSTALAGVRITLPVLDKNQGNRAAAAADVRRQEQLLHAAEQSIRADYDSALQEYEFRRAEFTDTLQPLREHAADIAKIACDAYQAGGTDLLRLLDAERLRLEAELAWARGLVEYRQSIASLEQAEGVER